MEGHEHAQPLAGPSAHTSSDILIISFFCKILRYIAPNDIANIFFYDHQQNLQNEKQVFMIFQKNPLLRNLTQYFWLINLQKYFAWPGFMSFPATMAIFNQIGDI